MERIITLEEAQGITKSNDKYSQMMQTLIGRINGAIRSAASKGENATCVAIEDGIKFNHDDRNKVTTDIKKTFPGFTVSYDNGSVTPIYCSVAARSPDKVSIGWEKNNSNLMWYSRLSDFSLGSLYYSPI